VCGHWQVWPEKEELEAWIIKDMDRLLGEAWLTGNEDVFQQIFHLILNENVSGSFVDLQFLGQTVADKFVLICFAQLWRTWLSNTIGK